MTKKIALLDSAIAKFIDKIEVPHLLELGGLAALTWMYYNWEKSTLFGPDHPPLDALKLAVPQALIDFMLLKTRTEVGVGLAVGHIAGRGFLELVESGIGVYQPTKKAVLP